MNRNPNLLAAVAAAPTDVGPRRVYSDWLMEKADPRGEYIAAMLTRNGPVDPVRRKIARLRADELFSAHRAAWSKDLEALGASRLVFSNGFVSEMHLAASKLLNFEAILALEPVTHLVVKLDDSGALAEVMKSPTFHRIRHLTIDGDADSWAEALGEVGGDDDDGDDEGTLCLKSFEALVLHGGSEAAVEFVASSKAFSKLQRLSVTGVEVGDAALEALAGGVLKLNTLYASRAGVSDEGVEGFVKSKAAAGLQFLALGGNELADEALAALASSTKLSKLKRLEVPANAFSDEGLEALLTPKALPALKSLDLRGMYFDDGVLDQLRSRFRDGLKV